MTLSKAGALFRKGKDIVREEGMMPFIMRAFLFLWRPLKSSFFSYRNYYIYEKTLNEADEAVVTPRLPNVTLKIIYSSEELDKLIKEGHDFSSYLNAEEIKKRIERKAILFCVFIGKELAHRSWAAMSNEAKMDVDILPFAVDFQNEVCVGSAETYPQCRGAGIYTYVYSEIYRFLGEKGWQKAKFTVQTDNIAPQRAQAKLGSKVYAKGRYLKLLRWEFWQEKPMKETKQQ